MDEHTLPAFLPDLFRFVHRKGSKAGGPFVTRHGVVHRAVQLARFKNKQAYLACGNEDNIHQSVILIGDRIVLRDERFESFLGDPQMDMRRSALNGRRNIALEAVSPRCICDDGRAVAVIIPAFRSSKPEFNDHPGNQPAIDRCPDSALYDVAFPHTRANWCILFVERAHDVNARWLAGGSGQEISRCHRIKVAEGQNNRNSRTDMSPVLMLARSKELRKCDVSATSL